MKALILNGRKMTTVERTHRYIKTRLSLPAYYGENLDALWDVLSTLGEPLYIQLINPHKLPENLGEYGTALLNIFMEANQANDNLHIEIII